MHDDVLSVRRKEIHDTSNKVMPFYLINLLTLLMRCKYSVRVNRREFFPFLFAFSKVAYCVAMISRTETQKIFIEMQENQYLFFSELLITSKLRRRAHLVRLLVLDPFKSTYERNKQHPEIITSFPILSRQILCYHHI